MLPPEIKTELNHLLIERGFSGYDEMAEWLNRRLAEAGLEITFSRSGLHRYGQSFEEKIARVKAATDMAVSLTDQVGDDAGKMSDAVVRMYQEKLFNVLLDMDDLDAENIDFVKLGRAIADITRSSVSQKKFMSEVKKKAEQAVKNIEIKAAGTGKKSLDAETMKIIKEEIYGIA